MRPDFETAPGLSGVVFFPSLRRSSGFQTLGLPSGLVTATFVDRRHRPARNWVEFLPRRVASLAGLCTAFSEHHGFASQLSDSPYTLHADSRDPSRFFYSYVMFCLYSGPLISLIDILNQLTCIYGLCIFERRNIHRQR